MLAWYHAHDLLVMPVTPSRSTIAVSDTTYSTISSPTLLPNPHDVSLSIITQPSITKQVLRQAKEAGVAAVWLQPGSYDDEGLLYAKKEFSVAIGGRGGGGSEGWCVLIDGEAALSEATHDTSLKI